MATVEQAATVEAVHVGELMGPNIGTARLDVSGTTVALGGQAAVAVFEKSPSGWQLQQAWAMENGANDTDISVSLSGDTLVAGVPGPYGTPADPDAAEHGAAYVYVRKDGVWSLQQKLSAVPGGTNRRFGFSVAVSGDTLMVADVFSNASWPCVTVFSRTNGSWLPLQVLQAPIYQAVKLVVELSGDDAVFGSINKLSGFVESHMGSVVTYRRNGSTWSFAQELASGVADDDFGYALAIDGDTLLVGAPWRTFKDNGQGDYPKDYGYVYVYTRSGGVWQSQTKLSGGFGVEFGVDVSVSGDLALVGAPGDYNVPDAPPIPTQDYAGKAHLFRRKGTNWVLEQAIESPLALLTEPDGFHPFPAWGLFFGGRVALSGSDAFVWETVTNTLHAYELQEPCTSTADCVSGQCENGLCSAAGDAGSDAMPDSGAVSSGGFAGVGGSAGSTSGPVGEAGTPPDPSEPAGAGGATVARGNGGCAVGGTRHGASWTAAALLGILWAAIRLRRQ